MSNCTTKTNSGGYNPNEEAPTVWAYLQDARWSTVKDIIVWNGREWGSSGTTCM